MKYENVRDKEIEWFIITLQPQSSIVGGEALQALQGGIAAVAAAVNVGAHIELQHRPLRSGRPSPLEH